MYATSCARTSAGVIPSNAKAKFWRPFRGISRKPETAGEFAARREDGDGAGVAERPFQTPLREVVPLHFWLGSRCHGALPFCALACKPRCTMR
jgi:hypothetical protein